MWLVRVCGAPAAERVGVEPGDLFREDVGLHLALAPLAVRGGAQRHAAAHAARLRRGQAQARR